MVEFGQDVKDGNPGKIYDLFDDKFKARVPRDLFIARVGSMKSLGDVDKFGTLASSRWNEEPMYFQTNSGSGEIIVTGMMFMQYGNMPEPIRELLSFSQQGGGKWMFNDLPRMFPTEKKPPSGGRPQMGP
jgi:hypothetical protein